jgi:mannose-6-phosphate isomerase-like protein (cupin superfamily)
MKPYQTISNKQTGETLTLLISEEDNGGVCNKYEIFLPAHRPSPPMHYHTDFIEIFTVKKGVLDFYLDKEKRRVSIGEGQSLTAEINQLHTFANDHGEPVIFTVEARPAGGLVKAFQLAYGVANEGGCGEDQLPANFLVKLYFIRLSQGYLPSIPLFFQKTLFAFATFILYVVGKKRKLDQYLEGCFDNQ